jgi:hypothetical protein
MYTPSGLTIYLDFDFDFDSYLDIDLYLDYDFNLYFKDKVANDLKVTPFYLKF